MLAAEKGLTQYREIMAWLKADFELGHGHANAIAQLLMYPGARKVKPDDRIAKLFAGSKEKWRKTCDDLLAKLAEFGPAILILATCHDALRRDTASDALRRGFGNAERLNLTPTQSIGARLVYQNENCCDAAE